MTNKIINIVLALQVGFFKHLSRVTSFNNDYIVIIIIITILYNST